MNALEFGALEEWYTWGERQSEWPGWGEAGRSAVSIFLLDIGKKFCSGRVNFVDKFVLYQIKALAVLFSKLHLFFLFIRCYWFCSWQNETDFNNSLTEFRISLKKKVLTAKITDCFLHDMGGGQMRESKELELVMVVNQSGLPAACKYWVPSVKKNSYRLLSISPLLLASWFGLILSGEFLVFRVSLQICPCSLSNSKLCMLD